MKRSGVYLCGFIIVVEFSVIVYLSARSNSKAVAPAHNPVLLQAYPCRDAEDITVWLEPALTATDAYRYYVLINKRFPASSVVNVTFDHKVNATFTIQSEETKFSRITLTRGDLFTLRFSAAQEGLGVIVQGLTPGLAPNLIGLTVNDVEYCRDPDVKILHKYDKTGNSSQDKGIWQAESHRLMKADLRNCGRRNVSTELVVDGAADPGAWPWYAALYDTSSSSAKYYCGGTLISRNFVLTAGHCVANRQAEHLLVMLGPRNFSEESTGRRVAEIMFPDNYDMFLIADDIALLKLERAFSGGAQPACLWRAAPGPQENTNGTIVGWGYDENDHLLANLQQANMPVVSSATCIAGNPDFVQILNGKNFCAGYSARGTAVCKGDGGMGLLVFKPDDKSPGGSGEVSGSWHIKGVLSFSARDSADSKCVESFAVFTEVDKYRDWILGNLED